MTDRFIDNFTPGDGTDGLTWAKAELTLAAVSAAAAAGDRFLTDYRHSESTGASINVALVGTLASPGQLLSVTQSGASGASALTAGAIVATGAGAYSITFTGSGYVYGHVFKGGVGSSSTLQIILGSGNQEYQVLDVCELWVATGHASSAGITVGASSTTTQGATRWLNTSVKFNHASNSIRLSHGDFDWVGGGAISGTTSPTNVLAPVAGMVSARLSGLDFSTFGSTVNLVTSAGDWCGKIVFRNIVMPASWSGTIGTCGNPGARIEAYNVAAAVASGENNFSMWIEDYAGSIKHETTIVRTGGASDGVNGLSHKIATSANAEWPTIVMRGPELYAWCNSTGSKTFTVHYVADENVAEGQGAGTSNAFRDDEFWIEVEALGTSDSPQASLASGVCGAIATPSDNASSSETWTTTGMTTPKKGKLEVTLTVNEKGPFIVRVCGAKASKTIYYCPKVVVS